MKGRFGRPKFVPQLRSRNMDRIHGKEYGLLDPGSININISMLSSIFHPRTSNSVVFMAHEGPYEKVPQIK
jgi:hypothetical protein